MSRQDRIDFESHYEYFDNLIQSEYVDIQHMEDDWEHVAANEGGGYANKLYDMANFIFSTISSRGDNE